MNGPSGRVGVRELDSLGFPSKASVRRTNSFAEI